MNRFSKTVLALLVFLIFSFYTNAQNLRPENSKSKSAEQPVFKNQIPDKPYNIIIGRPTLQNVTISVQMKDLAEGYVQFGLSESTLSGKTAIYSLHNSVAFIEIDSLQAYQRYYYQWIYRMAGKEGWEHSPIYTFQTGRKKNDPFVFTVQADSHLDENTDTSIYNRTLDNMHRDAPDFLVDLGDTWMTDKYRNNFQQAYQQYIAQRYYFGRVGNAAAVYFALGNHDGESGQQKGRQSENNMLSWSTATRNALYPNPFPNNFYVGNAEKFANGFIQNYYAFNWGDALILVLDPFRYTSNNRISWYRTLGKAQYEWMRETLQHSTSKYKFIFIHNLVGGVDDHGIARGGAEAAGFYEWGGSDSNGIRTFEQNRPDFYKDIATVFKESGVTVVFHGHDHFFAKQEKDGLVYQLVPQPGGTKYKTTNFKPEYGYAEGVLFSAPGYMRVTISSKSARIQFVQTGDGREQQNEKILYTYEIQPK